MTRKPRVLVSTILPSPGGVNTMTGYVVKSLRALGLEPVIAYYQPYSLSPELSVPSFRLLQRTVGEVEGRAFDGCESHAIGAWMPELEFTHYFATRHWRRLMDSCDAHVSVAGNVLAATAFWQSGRPFVAWVATDWAGDRKDRVREFSLPRRIIDRWVNAPFLRRYERRLLNAGTVLALSEYTARTLEAVAGPAFRVSILPMPVDAARFRPAPCATVPRRIGFSGRIDDPRKNIQLLLQALALLCQSDETVSALLIGGTPTQATLAMVEQVGLTGRIRFVPHVSSAEMPALLQTLDVFVLPSHQEGLCIAALEAMACGVPVVSTRCGGPEEFVIPGQTGLLVDFDAAQMAQAVQSILVDPALRAHLSLGARRIVEARHTYRRAESVFASALRATFPHLPVNASLSSP